MISEEIRDAIYSRLVDYAFDNGYYGEVPAEDIDIDEIAGLYEAIENEFNLDLSTDEAKDELTELIYEDLETILDGDIADEAGGYDD